MSLQLFCSRYPDSPRPVPSHTLDPHHSRDRLRIHSALLDDSNDL